MCCQLRNIVPTANLSFKNSWQHWNSTASRLVPYSVRSLHHVLFVAIPSKHTITFKSRLLSKDGFAVGCVGMSRVCVFFVWKSWHISTYSHVMPGAYVCGLHGHLTGKSAGGGFIIYSFNKVQMKSTGKAHNTSTCAGYGNRKFDSVNFELRMCDFTMFIFHFSLHTRA